MKKRTKIFISVEKVKILNKSVFSIPRVPDEIISRVLNQQTLGVDAITGATASSKAVLKAIENALKE